MKIAYANVQGKMGKQQIERWKELTQMITRENWDMLILIETHWRGKGGKVDVPGYTCLSQAREVTQKKGGGLMVLVKERFSTHEWHRSPEREQVIEKEGWKSDIMWVVTSVAEQQVAFGIVYLATGHQSKEWNEGIKDTLQHDMADLEREGYAIVLGSNMFVSTLEQEA